MPKVKKTSQTDFNDPLVAQDRMELMQELHRATGLPCAQLDPIIEAMLSGDDAPSALVVDTSGNIHTLDDLESGKVTLNRKHQKNILN